MELVYLWVEDYKNIHHQGFNFSGRYRCDYDGKNLTIEENNEYLHIFPENINVTAIVGKNGSGKSSLLVGLTNHKILVEKNNNLLSNDFIHADIKPLDRREDYEIIYVDFDLIKINPVRDSWDYACLNIYNKNLYTKVEEGSVGKNDFNIYKFRKNFFNLIVEYKRSFDSHLFFYNPSKIILSDYIHKVKSEDERWVKVNQLIEATHDNHLTREKFLVFIYENLNRQIQLSLPKIVKIEDLITHDAIFLEHAQYMNIEDFQYLYDFFDSLIYFEDKNQITIEEFIRIYNTHKEAFLKLIEIGYLQINFKDTVGREYDDLSQGERKLFTELLMVHDAIIKTEKEDVFVVLDEPDLTLHPEWQRKYINEMIDFLSKHSKNFHLIITSHSPFILSDIPKENIIFLDKDDKGNCKVVDGLKEKKQTFGANIHTLLSDSFFMDDGLMGEFAKAKINEVITLLNSKRKLSKKNQKFCEDIISIIGEPILRKTLQHQFDQKLNANTNETELEKLEREQKEIQGKIDKLKSAHHETN